LIADLISESAHLFRAVAPVLGIVKMGLVGHARLRQRRGGSPSSTSISGLAQRFVILGNPEHHFLGFFIGYYVSDGARVYCFSRRK
jgi:hypothetical protein